MQEIKVVLGALFGDEGKGVTVQWLCKTAMDEGKTVAVVRFSGGPQAAHTVRHNGMEHICSTYGSGVLLGVPTYYVAGSVFDPICAYNEWKVLSGKMDTVPDIKLMNYLPCITHYDVEANRKDTKALTDGTCGKGVWACINRHNSREYFMYTYSQFLLFKHKDKTFQSVCDYYQTERDLDMDELYSNVCKERFFTVFHDNRKLAEELKGYDVVIFEGTQGLLLDAKKGFFPNVTATEVGLDPVMEYITHYEFGVTPEVYLITRTYLTRHGNGYEPRHALEWDLSGKSETNVLNQYQGEFKTGAYERKLVERAVDRHTLDWFDRKMHIPFKLVVTHMDVALKNGFFDLDNGDGSYIHTDIDENNGVAYVMDRISECFDLDFKGLFYNDSPDSNIKVYESNK